MITMTPGGKPRGDRPLAYVPWKMRNRNRLFEKCTHAHLCHDYYDRWRDYHCTIDRDQDAESCADYEPKTEE